VTHFWNGIPFNCLSSFHRKIAHLATGTLSIVEDRPIGGADGRIGSVLTAAVFVAAGARAIKQKSAPAARNQRQSRAAWRASADAVVGGGQGAQPVARRAAAAPAAAACAAGAAAVTPRRSPQQKEADGQDGRVERTAQGPR